MKTLDGNKSIVFVGDHHGAWGSLWDCIIAYKLESCNLVSVGDLGIGFNYTRDKELKACENLNKKFKERNINFYGIRGNHDDPYFFKDNKICLDHFELIEDYSVYSYQDKQIQFIGGAVSVDRSARQLNVSYWADEGVVYQKNKLQKVDILVTHTAPSYCFPQKFNEIVYGWAREDAYLIEDLNDERLVVDEIFKVCKPSFHVYGHFHSSWTEEINGCRHKLLDIEEFYEHR